MVLAVVSVPARNRSTHIVISCSSKNHFETFHAFASLILATCKVSSCIHFHFLYVNVHKVSQMVIIKTLQMIMQRFLKISNVLLF